MKKVLSTLLFIAFPLALLSSQAVASVSVGAVFSQGEINIIAEWYHEHGSRSAHGKGKKKPKGLPPGIAKNLAMGKPLPPGIAKQMLPHDLLELLPPPRRGFERVVVDGKVLLVEVATRVIHDILTDVILH
jgi:Ni/Co efflux regulator RcnB